MPTAKAKNVKKIINNRNLKAKYFQKDKIESKLKEEIKEV